MHYAYLARIDQRKALTLQRYTYVQVGKAKKSTPTLLKKNKFIEDKHYHKSLFSVHDLL